MSGETSDKISRSDTNALFERLFEFSMDTVLVTDQTGSIDHARPDALFRACAQFRLHARLRHGFANYNTIPAPISLFY